MVMYPDLGDTLKILALAPALILALTACGSPADEDRKSGKNPDTLDDTTNVIVYRNADRVPNVAYFCADGYGWASTLSGTDSAGTLPANIVRFPEYDSECPTASVGTDPQVQPR